MNVSGLGVKYTHVAALTAGLFLVGVASGQAQSRNSERTLRWSELPSLPDPVGVAGPFAGVHKDALIVAGGANFPLPVWESEKQWHDSIHVLTRSADGEYSWHAGGSLPRQVAYGAAVSTPQGIVCIGGNDSENTFADVFLLAYEPQTGKVKIEPLPSLPEPRAFAGAALIGTQVFLVAGQASASLDSAAADLWSLDLANRGQSGWGWRVHPPLPGPPRALHVTAAQHNGTDEAMYVISGRRQVADQTEFLTDVWQYVPRSEQWIRCRDVPQCVMAGPGISYGESEIWVLGGADGSLFHRTEELRENHPGFPRRAYAYDTLTDRWVSAGTTPANHVTTIAVQWRGDVIVPSGEIRPRVRSPKVWRVNPRN